MAIVNQHEAFKKKSGMKKFPVNTSGFIAFFSYDADASQLTVVLKSGGEYVYDNVDGAIVDQFVQAPSKGRFYSQYIKGKFESTRLIDKTVGPEEGQHGIKRSRDRFGKDPGASRAGKSGRSRYGY